jgi:hypothetical protein
MADSNQLDFLMKSNSLHDMLGILASICENLELKYLNPRLRHFKYFQFTFFGLMVKAKGLLDIMVLKAEFLKESLYEFEETYAKLILLRKNLGPAYNLISKRKMLEGRDKIIELNEEYSPIFKTLVKVCDESKGEV